ncbi:hypothetical protein AB0L53_24865 [Nonomuraea sp. NPDC052129]|uniref:hypothetical protein n=1 Tax=Nonomuraea sp. NPDC052129 TaxID=3154651 RepID=UPI00343B7397
MIKAACWPRTKQRHTAKRVFDRRVEEHGAAGVSYGLVRADVGKRRPQIRLAAGWALAEVFIEQSHQPGVGLVSDGSAIR